MHVNATELIEFKTANNVIKLGDLKGKVVYIDFWASWCKPCRKSFPWMNDLHSRYSKDGLTIIAVNLDTDKELVNKFLQKYPADFTIAYDPEGKLAKQFEVKGMPSSYIISRHGKKVFSHVGYREKNVSMVESVLEKQLNIK